MDVIGDDKVRNLGKWKYKWTKNQPKSKTILVQKTEQKQPSNESTIPFLSCILKTLTYLTVDFETPYTRVVWSRSIPSLFVFFILLIKQIAIQFFIKIQKTKGIDPYVLLILENVIFNWQKKLDEYIADNPITKCCMSSPYI